MTSATVFQSDAPLDERRVIIRRHDGDVEMVELPWGLRPRDGDARAVNVVRSKGRTFPTHRCLVPASEFRHRTFSFSLANGDWFYFAGIWRPAINDWPESYAILTIEANDDLAPFHDRQMVVLRREQRMAGSTDWYPKAKSFAGCRQGHSGLRAIQLSCSADAGSLKRQPQLRFRL